MLNLITARIKGWTRGPLVVFWLFAALCEFEMLRLRRTGSDSLARGNLRAIH
jgi:hypothetical protein